MRLTRRPMLLQLDARKGIPPLDSMNNLLTDPVIRADHADGSRKTLALPEVYEVMMADLVTGFPALRPHQRHAWHAFLAQLGVIALVRAGREEPPRSASKWHDLIRALTPDFPEDEPWCLVVEDVSKPAFMQCPVPTEGLENVEEDYKLENDYKKKIVAPDDLDVLVTSKNHDVKGSIAAHAQLDDWMFSLISVQTMGGYRSRWYRGIARMKSQHASRPCLGLAPALGGIGAHLAHDISSMVAHRRDLVLHSDYFQSRNGTSLLWMRPWGGTTSMGLREVDPYFVEICRRIRLATRGGCLVALTATNTKRRVAAQHAQGNVGDHWTPILRKDRTALFVSRVGFRYDRLAELVLDHKKYDQPRAMAVDVSAKESWRLIARGLGMLPMAKTAGYHERSDIVLGPTVTSALLGGSAQRNELERLARDQLAEVEAVAKALRGAIAVAASGGKDATDISKSDREKAYPYTRRLDDTVDVHFFAALQDRFNAAESERHSAQRRFATVLIDRAKSLLREATATVPCARIQRYRARARAECAFWRNLTKSGVIDLDEGLRG